MSALDLRLICSLTYRREDRGEGVASRKGCGERSVRLCYDKKQVYSTSKVGNGVTAGFPRSGCQTFKWSRRRSAAYRCFDSVLISICAKERSLQSAIRGRATRYIFEKSEAVSTNYESRFFHHRDANVVHFFPKGIIPIFLTQIFDDIKIFRSGLCNMALF
jgi:hypothetical protein